MVGQLADAVAQCRHLATELRLRGDSGIELLQLHRQAVETCKPLTHAIANVALGATTAPSTIINWWTGESMR